MSRTSRVATLAVLVGIICSATALAAARAPHLKLVRYLGISVRVPASWPVFDLARAPGTCVRFDRHAVYLGRAGRGQHCPAHAVGRTEALLLAPLSAGSAAGASASGLPSGPRSTRLSLGRGRLLVSATWDRHPGLIQRALAVRTLPPVSSPPTAAGAPVARAASGAPRRARAARPTIGLGFDACATPSTGTMSAWLSSPYRTVGVYLGGANMACSQPNLTSSWVSTETSAGWHFIPTYVGLQAPTNSCGCARISSSQATSQGAAAARDAVTNAQGVGIGRGNPIYFDMEAYSIGGSATRTVLSFLSAWTSTLHAEGYLSGVYSSGGSGISDFAAAQGTSFVEPDDIWVADWNGRLTTADPYVPSNVWAFHQRIHQYSGGVDRTYGGVTINIDGDYLDGAAASAGAGGISPFPDGTFVQVSGTGTGPVYRIAGGAPLLVSDWAPFGGPQPVTTITPDQLNSLSPFPADGTFLVTTTGKIFRVAGGAALPARGWDVFGGIQPSVTIDQWDIDNVLNPAAHLRAQPTPGTVVQGLPSRIFWQFMAGGRRVRVGASPVAVAVDDAALTRYAVTASVPRCLVPPLRHLTIPAARRAIARAHCRLGKVRRPRHVSRLHVLHVLHQTPAPRVRHSVGWRVGVWMG